MIFYSNREPVEAGSTERDYIDTEDFKDVFFEKDEFLVISDQKVSRKQISYELLFDAVNSKVLLRGSCDLNKIEVYTIEVNPENIAAQGAVASIEHELLDEIAEIKNAKLIISDKIKEIALEEGFLIRGASMDVLGLIANNNNIIAIIDDITIINENTISAKRHFSIVNPTSISGDIEIYLSSKRKMTATVVSLSLDEDKLNLIIENSVIINEENDLDFSRSRSFASSEDYHLDRAKYISVSDSADDNFDEFDDLF